MKTLVALATLVGILGTASAPGPVSVSVFVQDGDAPVGGLTKADFTLLDDGVEQAIDSVAIDGRPVDVTLLRDVSAVVPPTLDQLTKEIGGIARLLTADDRLRVITFGAEVVTTVPLQPVGQPPSIGLVARGGGASLNAAMLSALIQPVEPNRRSLMVLVTAGRDSDLVLGADQLSAVAARSAGVLIVLLTSQTFTGLGDIVRTSGGAIYGLNGDLASAFNGVLENFKGSYLVRWTPHQVKPDGWHELKVTVPKFKKYVVRARKGYMSAGAGAAATSSNRGTPLSR